MKAKLGEWNADLAKFEAKARGASAEQRIEFGKQVEALKNKRDEAAGKMKEIQAAGEDAWKDLAAGVEGAWNSIGDAFKSAASKFK